MGNCLKSCYLFGKVTPKRNQYFTGRYNNASIDIEFENLIEDDEVQREHSVLTEDERNHLLNRRYTDLVQAQQQLDAKLDKELALEEENARLEEEAYQAARREAARAANQARALERQKQGSSKEQQSNGSAKSWLGADAGDWEIATEDDFETFLETVKAKSETVRASVASMLNQHTSTSTNPVITNQPTSPVTSPTAKPVAPVSSPAPFQTTSFISPPVDAVVTHSNATPKSTSPLRANQNTSPMINQSSPAPVKNSTPPQKSPASESEFNSYITPGGKLGEGPVNGGLVGEVGSVSDKPDVVHEASQRATTLGDTQGDGEMGNEGFVIQPDSGWSNHKQSSISDDDSDVEWEADFVSADSTPEPIHVSPAKTPTASTPSVASRVTPVSSSRSQPIRTGLPSNARTNGSVVANGKLPHVQEREKEIVTTSPSSAKGKTATAETVKPKKSLDIDIDKFLEELDFET